MRKNVSLGMHIPTRLDWKSTEFRRKFPLNFRLESVDKEMVGTRRNRQESTENASDPTQLLTDSAIGMLDLGMLPLDCSKVIRLLAERFIHVDRD